MRKVVFVIDGWFMRKCVYRLRSFHYDGKEIRKYCKRHLRPGDNMVRIFYYDTKPLDKTGHHLLTNKYVDFKKTETAKSQDKLLKSIKETPNFALRLGKTVWVRNGWILNPDKLKALIKKKISVEDLQEADIKPFIQQKAVDMKMGIDIALIAIKRTADLLIVIAGDSDIVPALKLARREGLVVGLDPLGSPIQPDLSEHVDFVTSYIHKYTV